MGDFCFRQGSLDDLPELLILEKQAHYSPWPQRIFESMFSQSSVQCTVMEWGDKIIGFMFVQSAADESSLLNIVIRTEEQGKGTGRILLNHMIDTLIKEETIANFFLEVRVSNFAAIRLYLSCGFVEVGERRAYYEAKHGSREDALIMALPLKVG